MARATVKNIPEDHVVVRYCSPARLRRDEHNNAIGVLPDAFRLRSGEAYLSAGWLDKFEGEREQKLRLVLKAYDPSPLEIKPNGGFALGKVLGIKEVGRSHGQSFRIVSEPKKTNACYVAVRQYRDDVEEMLSQLADEAWADLVQIKDIK